jgi:tripartite-type tricarboxylate transporter receptor subunit TctC
MGEASARSGISRRGVIKAGVTAAVAAPVVLRALAALAAYPDRPVKIVVANTPGGPSDIVGRFVAAALGEATGKNFIIENRGGAGGNIGMAYVAHAEPDGYTILLATNAFSVNVTLYNELPYAPDDFVGVCELASSPNCFVVRSELPARTLADFVTQARANPEKYNGGTPPIGTTPQLQLELLKIRAQLPKLEDVVFKGGGDAITALLSGTVQLGSSALAPAAPHIKSGAMRCLAVTSAARWPEFPDTPTMAESGFNDFVFATDAVLLAPARTPPDIVKWLERETLKVLGAPGMQQKLFEAGFQVRLKGGGDAAWARVTKEIDLFKGIIEQAGIKKL